jgi:hypothetical protein
MNLCIPQFLSFPCRNLDLAFYSLKTNEEKEKERNQIVDVDKLGYFTCKCGEKKKLLF